MLARFSTLFPLLLLGALAALTYWLDHSMQEPLAARDKRAVHEPDYTVDQLIATRMDTAGRIRDTLQTAQLVHYPDDDSAVLIQPRFVSFAHGNPLSITAKQGRVTSNGGNIYFTGEVQATRAARGDTGALVVTTDYLHVLPDDDIVRTDRPVTIRDAMLTVRAGGMELNTEKRILKLHTGVRGVYHDTLSAPFPAAGAKR